ncbi:hypothetical protein WJX77_008188 [Trebouxia sp. C0004]
MNATSNLSAAIGNASSNSNGSRLSKKHCWQNAVNEQTRGAGAGSTALQQMGKPFAGTVASVPELSRQMSQMPLEGDQSERVSCASQCGEYIQGCDCQYVKANGRLFFRKGSLQQRIKSGSTLTYHADTSATPEPVVIGDAMHTANAKDEKQTWMLLEYCDRGSIEGACVQNKFTNRLDGKPNMVNLYKSLQDIAAGMDYLHSLRVLHGDLKGANVLLKSTATDSRGFKSKLADLD